MRLFLSLTKESVVSVLFNYNLGYKCDMNIHVFNRGEYDSICIHS